MTAGEMIVNQKLQSMSIAGRPFVLHVVRSLETGGLERVVSELTIARGVDATQVACLVARGAFAAKIEEHKGTVHVLSQNATSKLALASRLVHLVRELRPDVIHCHNMLSHIYGSIAAIVGGRIPTVLTKHGPFLPTGRIGCAAQRFFFRRTRVVAVSEEIRDLLARWGPSGRAHVTYIPNGVAVRCEATPEERYAAREQLGWLPGQWIFLSVSRIVAQKGLEHLITAFARVRRLQPSARLVIVGDGPMSPELQALAASLNLSGVVSFLGQRMDVSRLLSAADTFVIPSEVEGTPMALLEAMAAGLPVIASAVGAMPVVVNDGEGGVLVPPRSPEILADAMLQMMADPPHAAKTGTAARRRVVQKFSLSSTVEMYEAVYRSAICPRNTHVCANGLGTFFSTSATDDAAPIR